MRLKRLITEYLGLALVLGLLVLFFSLRTQQFLTAANFTVIANQIPAITVVAVGMTFVLIIAGIDLSVGSVLALSGAVLGVALVDWQWPLAPAIGLCVAVGLLCGAVNGLIVITWSLPSFIATLGMLEMARGGAYLVTESRTKYIGRPIEIVSDTELAGFSLPFLIAVAVMVIGQGVLSLTAFGRHMLALGANESAARLSGIPVRRIQLTVFMQCAMLSAVAAVIQCSRLSASDPSAGIGFELQAIAAVVIGGTSLMGGRGSVVGSFFGVLIIAVLDNGLAQLGAQEHTKRVVTGAIIVVAVVADYYRRRYGARQTGP